MMLAMLVWTEVTFAKTVLDTRFVSEGVAVADINRDGKMDILAGNVWYQAPTWKPHEIAPVQTLNPKTQYSNCFHNWAEDLNKDGWPDQILIGMPGDKAVWRENPGSTGAWKEHPIWPSACNESPLYEDLLGNGKRVLIMGSNDDVLAYFDPGADPTQPWKMIPISGSKGAGAQRYAHGLGVGDLDGDGTNEVLTTQGYYRRGLGGWAFTKADLGPDCAHMNVLQGQTLTTSAHAKGVWLFDREFKRTEVDASVGQTHSAVLTRLRPGGPQNLITGKRKWAHRPGVDPGSEEPALLVRYEQTGDKWVRHVIDESSGVGTQFAVADVDGDGLEDIVTANKNGVFLFRQR